MAIKLIAMDLDGTLLNSDKLISARNLAAIEAARARGVGVTIATGRMYRAAAFFWPYHQGKRASYLLQWRAGAFHEAGKTGLCPSCGSYRCT